MRHFITGGSGFIGSTLAERLIQSGHQVVVYDNLSTGREEFLSQARRSAELQFVRGDILDGDLLASSMTGCDTVFHLAANADVRFGTHHPERDLQQNTIGTFTVLEAMRRAGISRIAFSSTGSIYGEPAVFPTPEDAPFPVQTSLYGASKQAGEGLISAYCNGFGFHGIVFRFVSILGRRYTHGHVFDFCKSLLTDPQRLRVLGNGRQRKSYLYVEDCIDAMLLALSSSTGGYHVFNLGTDEYCEVNQSIGWITSRMGVNPTLQYSGGERGWIGDSPFILLDCARIRALGWKPTKTIEQAVTETVDYLLANQHLFQGKA